MGALITAAVTSFRNRLQPVGRLIEVSQVFSHRIGGEDLHPTLTVTEREKQYSFDNLYLARIQLANLANCDFKTFSFGITLPTTQKIVLAYSRNSDRHHKLTLENSPSPENPLSELDGACTPLNRKDIYFLDLYINCEVDAFPEVLLSSHEPIRFVEIPTASAILKEAGKVFINVLGYHFPIK